MPAPDPVARLQLAQNEIDRVFGPGFSREHPELVSSVLLSASMDFAALTIARAMHDIASAMLVDESIGNSGSPYRPPLVR